jgi:hypothetical protein
LPTKSVNSASRAHEILSRASNRPGSNSTLSTWVTAFGLDGIHFMDHDFEAVRLLGLLREEIALARAQMHDTGALDDDSYAFAFAGAFQATDISDLGGSWEPLRRNLTGEVLRMLRICAQLTPAQEAPVGEEQLAKLDTDLVEFEDSVRGSGLPAEVIAFIVDQIHVIRRAILEYRVIGSRAFRRASVDFATNVAENRDLNRAKFR